MSSRSDEWREFIERFEQLAWGKRAKRGEGDTPELAPAKITLLYESRDGKLCLFEDANGHLTAVRASKLV